MVHMNILFATVFWTDWPRPLSWPHTSWPLPHMANRQSHIEAAFIC